MFFLQIHYPYFHIYLQNDELFNHQSILLNYSLYLLLCIYLDSFLSIYELWKIFRIQHSPTLKYSFLLNLYHWASLQNCCSHSHSFQLSSNLMIYFFIYFSYLLDAIFMNYMGLKLTTSNVLYVITSYIYFYLTCYKYLVFILNWYGNIKQF